jgi:hypothetical protein
MEDILRKLKLPELKAIVRYYNKEVKIPLSLRKPELISRLLDHLQRPVELDIEVAKKPIERPKRLKRQISQETDSNLKKLAEADVRLLQEKPKPAPKQAPKSKPASKPVLDEATIRKRLAELESFQRLIGPMV